MLYLFCISVLAVGVCGVVPTEDMVLTSGTTTLDPGIYYLDDTEGDGAIKIGASDVTLDCNGAEIIGTGSGYGIVGNGSFDMQQLMEATENLNNPIPILENMDLFISSITFLENVAIKNCVISGYENGINMTAFKNMTLSNNNMSNNTRGANIFIGYESRVYNNRIFNNIHGIYSISINTLLSNNTAYNNTGIGIINAGIGCNSSDNNAYGNGLGIISVGFYNKVFGNNVNGNGRSGNIKGGILAFGGNGTEIYGNTANNNNGSGIAMINIADVKVYNNTANFNDYGISVGGFMQGGESYMINISNNTVWYSMKAGIMLSDATFEKMLRASMTGKTAGAGHVIRDSYIVGNNLNNGAWYADADLYIDDSSGSHIFSNVVMGNNFSGWGVHDDHPFNNDYCGGNYYSDDASRWSTNFAIRNVTMFTSQEGSFLNGTIDVCDLDMDDDVSCWIPDYSKGGLYEMVVNPDCTITSNESIDYFWRNGTYTAVFMAQDPDFGNVSFSRNITVANVNRAPNITAINIYNPIPPPTYPNEGKRLYGDVYGDDPDGGSVECELISSTMPDLKMQPNVCSFCYCSVEPCWTSCGVNCWSCTGSEPLPSASEVIYDVTVKMTDGSLEDNFQKNFEVQRPPTKPNSTDCEGVPGPCGPTINGWVENPFFPYTFTLNSSDPNGDPIIYESTTLPSGATLTNGLFLWNPDCSQGRSDPYTIGFKAKDDHNLTSDVYTMWITVDDTEVC